jgi:hypothetical protein
MFLLFLVAHLVAAVRRCVEVMPERWLARERVIGVPEITRERVKEWAGTRTHLTDFSVLLCGQYSHRSAAFLSGGIMANPLHRARPRRDLAEDCHAIAELCVVSGK